SAVVRHMNFGNSDPAAAFTAKHAVGLDQSLGDISLAHRRAHDFSAVTRGDDVDRTGRRDVCNNSPGFLSQTNISGDSERHLLGKWLAKVADNSQALAIGVMGEADGGAASLHNCTELGHSLGLRLGSVREGGI